MSERTNTIGVRGAFTAECLDLMGIHNYRIIGCPSMFSADLCTVPFKYSLWLSFDLQKIDYRCVSESIYRYDISKNWFNSTKYYSNSSSCCYT